jgi:hypothetical protein
MVKLLDVTSTAVVGYAVLLLVVCGVADTPTASALPDWIVNPSTLPSDRVGKNNCKFEFDVKVPKWDFHPDAGCWETDGPGGWTRQQFQKIHVPNFHACDHGPGDANAIRVCRPPGGKEQPPPGCIDRTTSPRSGCARCVVNPTCHKSQ